MSGVFSSTARAIRSAATRLTIGSIADGQILKRVGTAIVGAAAGGDASGPASSTDNAIVRFDGTGGKTLQNSAATVDDNGSINIPTGQTYKINNGALAKGDVGLGNVTNTSDADKPVSTAQQTALNLKANDADVVHDTGDETIAGAKTFTGAITPSQTAGIVGTTTNNNANAGSVGEVISAQAATGTVSLTNNTGANITSISLTAGDWDVWANIKFTPDATTTVSYLICQISTTSATVSATDMAGGSVEFIDLVLGSSWAYTVPTKKRISIAATTTIYLVAQGGFGASTLTAGGIIEARRMR